MTQATAPNPLGQRVLRQHLAAVYASRNTAIVAHLGFAVGLGVILFAQQGEVSVLAWMAVLVAIDVFVLVKRRWTPAEPASDSASWARRCTRDMTLISAVTAPAPFFFVSAEHLVVTTLFVVVIQSSWTRAMQALWPLKSALIGYGIPMMTGLIVALAWQGDGVHLFLAGFGAVHLVLTLRTGIQQNKLLTDSLMLRFENEALAARLGDQIAATERASREKTRFLATASHDLRQPLHAIALFGAALENALRQRPEGQNAERLMRSVNALGTSLDTMLDVSRLDAGVVTPEPQAVQLDAIFLSLNQTFAAQAEEKNLQLRMRASGLWVSSDPQLLDRMLANLIDNALKYTTQGGASVTARSRGGKVWIDVHDTGIGIAPEQVAHIFEEFYQVDNPGRDRARGLGIGLSIVQRLSRLLDHEVKVDSRRGHGSRFRVVLQSIDAPSGGVAAPPSRVPPPIRRPLPARVLLIDDESEIRHAMTELLRSYGVEVSAVANEAEAMEVLQRMGAKARAFNLLLCDYRLSGGVDGLDVGLRLRQHLGIGLPLLLITGETAPDRLQRVRTSGVPVLFKPVDPDALLRAMAEFAC